MLAVSLGVAGWFGYRHGKQNVLGAGMAFSLLAGSWFNVTVFETNINVSMATAIALLTVYCLHSWRQIFRRLNLLDMLIGGIAFWHVVVDVYYGAQTVAMMAKAYGQWMLPYAAGRYAFLHKGSLKTLSPVMSWACIALSFAAVLEAFTFYNLWEIAFCEVDDLVTRVTAKRFDLIYRAMGPVRNPIFLAIVFLTMIPFAANLTTSQSSSSREKALGWIALAMIAVGILATVSRGPILCLPIAAIAAAAYWNRYVRWLTLACCVVFVGVCTFQFEQIEKLLDGGEGKKAPGRILQIDGEDELVMYNNARHRLLIPRVYGPIVIKGGAMGYGSEASYGFPPKNIPGLPKDPQTRSTLRNVDNAYLNIGLAFGLVGTAIFASLFAVTIVLGLRLAPTASTYLYPSDARVAVACSSVIFAIMLEVFTVHWSYDYGFWVLFLMGTIAGLTSQVSRVRRGELID